MGCYSLNGRGGISMMEFEGFKFDSDSGCLYRDGFDDPVVIRHKLLELLSYLVKHRDRIVSKEELLTALWEHGQYREHSLSQSILELRKVLGDSASSPKYIRTVPNKGFQWISPITLPRQKLRLLPNRLLLIAGTAAFFAFFLLLIVFISSQSQKQAEQNLKVWVLPFENRTEIQSMNWVEFGLADMMASDLMLIDGLNVIPPAQLSALLLTERGEHRSDTEFIKLLLEETAIDIAIKAEVNLVNNQQTLSYQLISLESEPIDGLIVRKDLAVAMPDVVNELFVKLSPQSKQQELPKYDYEPSAMHEYARGVQALTNEGAILARHYFGASAQIDPRHYWSLAYLGVCQLYLGQWEDAKKLLMRVSEKDKDKNIQAFVKYWLALLEFRQGNLKQASLLLTQVNAVEISPAGGSQLGRWVNQLNSQLTFLQSSDFKQGTINYLQEPLPVEVFGEWFGGYSLRDAPFNISLANDIKQLKEEVRRLAIKGYKPLLFSRLLLLAQQSELEAKERQFYLYQALNVIDELQQPYEYAQTLVLAARYAIAHGKELDIQRQEILDLLDKAKEIASTINNEYLLSKVEYFYQLANPRLDE